MIRHLVLLGGLLALFFPAKGMAEVPTVGLPATIKDLVLPGSELEVIPLEDRKTPVVLRITQVSPHGTAFRYDLEYYGLDPGTFNLKDYLRRKDRSSTADLPAIPVTVKSILPPGQVTPNPLAQKRTPWLGGYWVLVICGAFLWALGLWGLVFLGRRKAVAARAAEKVYTVADYLRPLVEGARSGKLSPGRLAELERTLIAYWMVRLRLENKEPQEALAILRGHPESGPLLQQLEIWLHRPGRSGSIDVATLLEPYRGFSVETIEGVAAGS